MKRQFVSLLCVAVLFAAPAPPLEAQPTNYTEVTALVFSADGKKLYSAALNGQIAVWDVASGAKQRDVDAHKEGTYALALSKDGKHLASAGGDALVKLWDAQTLKELRSFAGHHKDVFAVALAPDGMSIASGGADKAIRLWDVATGKQKYAVHGHELRVTALAFSPDGKTLASGGTCTAVLPVFVGTAHADQIRLYDAATGKGIRNLEQCGTVLTFSSDGAVVASGGMHLAATSEGHGVSIYGGARVQVRQLASNRELLSFKGQGCALALSADGKFLASAWGSRQHLGRHMVENDIQHRRAALWELASGKEVLQLAENDATVVAITPNGKRLALGRNNSTVVFIDLTPPGWNTEQRLANLDAQQFDRHWETLAGANAPAAYESICTWLVAGAKAAPYFKERLKPASSGGPLAARLIADLDSPKYPVREAAYRDLKNLGGVIEPELRKALAGKASPEARKRMQALLEPLQRHPANVDELRQSRALLILERLGTTDAHELLTQLAKGAPGAWLTMEAQSALDRLQLTAGK